MPTESGRERPYLPRLGYVAIVVSALWMVALSNVAGQCPCYVILPDCTDADLDCRTLETWVYCLAQCCAQSPDQAAALRKECASNLPYSCPGLNCGLSCDLLQNCESNSGGGSGGGGGEGDGLATKWVVLIALVSALTGVTAMSALLAFVGAWRKRTVQSYETVN